MVKLPTITSASIADISGLERQPVFFLKVKEGNAVPATHNLVVKGEKVSEAFADSARWAGKVMKYAGGNPLVKYKPLTAAERSAFRKAVAVKYPDGTGQRAQIANMGFWMKSPYVAGLSNAEVAPAAGAGANDSINVVRNVAEELSSGEMWRTIGGIIAGDAFSGNCDRFDTDRSSPTWGKCINPGNIMFLRDGFTSAIGLDTFDPTGIGQQMGMAEPTQRAVLSPVDDQPLVYDRSGLDILTSAPVRAEFAQKALSDIGKMLAGQLSVFSNAPISLKLDADDMVIMPQADLKQHFLQYADDLEAGIEAGARALRNALQIKLRRMRTVPGAKPLPRGVLERMSYLGWDVIDGMSRGPKALVGKIMDKFRR